MPDGHISATEANRNFSKVLRDVEGGARVTITKDGRPVAVLLPAAASDSGRREGARRRMMALLEEGLPLGFTGGVDRDALHER
ncbi:type II toxin-antitoxin system Phd/YefM family antitoxin [Azospirillum sp. ST 5-10]|uniref:type II toxin-antitoxin system Phd/YefM family antitoxin n=1 Tax=unclassified Azospirillum TaxID=2630922 RepID=UPI003F4A2CF2